MRLLSSGDAYPILALSQKFPLLNNVWLSSWRLEVCHNRKEVFHGKAGRSADADMLMNEFSKGMRKKS